MKYPNNEAHFQTCTVTILSDSYKFKLKKKPSIKNYHLFIVVHHRW